MCSKTSVAYIAGLLDGEGSICLMKRNACGQVHFRVQIVNTDKKVLNFVKRELKLGKIYTFRPTSVSGNVKIAHQITFDKPEIKTLLPLLLPYLIIKKKQAVLLLKYFELMDRTSNHDSWRKAVVDAYTVKFAALNKRGIK